MPNFVLYNNHLLTTHVWSSILRLLVPSSTSLRRYLFLIISFLHAFISNPEPFTYRSTCTKICFKWSVACAAQCTLIPLRQHCPYRCTVCYALGVCNGRMFFMVFDLSGTLDVLDGCWTKRLLCPLRRLVFSLTGYLATLFTRQTRWSTGLVIMQQVVLGYILPLELWDWRLLHVLPSFGM